MITSAIASSITLGSIARVPGPQNRAPDLAGDFTSLLSDFSQKAVSTLHQAENVSLAGLMSKASTREVAEAVMSAEQTLQIGLAIRDKITAAYLEISRMSI